MPVREEIRYNRAEVSMSGRRRFQLKIITPCTHTHTLMCRACKLCLAVAVRDASRQRNLNINRGPAVATNWLSKCGASLMIVYDLRRSWVRLLLRGQLATEFRWRIAKMSVRLCRPFLFLFLFCLPYAKPVKCRR